MKQTINQPKNQTSNHLFESQTIVPLIKSNVVYFYYLTKCEKFLVFFSNEMQLCIIKPANPIYLVLINLGVLQREAYHLAATTAPPFPPLHRCREPILFCAS
jgi:hypothetical protein